MRRIHAIIVCLVLATSAVMAWASGDQRENIPDFTEMFFSDVISILPPELRRAVESRKEQLKSDCKLAALASSKSMYLLPQEHFAARYRTAPTTDSRLTVWLASATEDTFRASFRSSAPDPFHERFRKNLKTFYGKYLSQTALVNYRGYQGESVEEVAAQIYDSCRITDEGQKYAALVQLTANLWTAGWKSGGGAVSTVASSFERVNSRFSRTAVAAVKPVKGVDKNQRAKAKTKAKKRFEGAIELYVTEWCPRCAEAEAYVKQMGYPYVKNDVEKDSAARKRQDGYPGRGVPLVVVGTRNFRGFSPEALESYMEL